MKAGSWCSSRSGLFGIDGLIALFVFELCRNIVGQGHLANLVQNRVEIPLIGEFRQPLTAFQHFQDFCVEQSIPKGELRAGLGSAPRAAEHLPHILFLLVNGVAGLLFRREIPAKYEGYVHVAGMIALLALMAVVAMNDILRIVTR